MKNLTDDHNWEGTAKSLAVRAKESLTAKDIGDTSFEPNERLIRDYVSRGILSRPERKNKEALFGFEQLAQFLACRAMIESGWPLSQVSDEFQLSTLEDLMDWIPGESGSNKALQLVKSFRADVENRKRAPSSHIKASYSSPTDPTRDSTNFSHRRRESLQSKTKISELLKSIGSELIEPRKVECTTFQLATWLTLVIENEKIDKLSRQDAENIGSTVTATLLSKNSLKDKIISNQKDYKIQISELKDQIKDLRKTVDALLKTKHQIQSEILDMKGDGGTAMKAITEMEKERDSLLAKLEVADLEKSNFVNALKDKYKTKYETETGN